MEELSQQHLTQKHSFAVNLPASSNVPISTGYHLHVAALGEWTVSRLCPSTLLQPTIQAVLQQPPAAGNSSSSSSGSGASAQSRRDLHLTAWADADAQKEQPVVTCHVAVTQWHLMERNPATYEVGGWMGSRIRAPASLPYGSVDLGISRQSQLSVLLIAA